MTSGLRFQTTIEPTLAETARYEHMPSPPSKKQKMSLSETYFVAASARQKLGREAGRADHNLRRLVGHANLLDNLMVDLADAEREQEAWFNKPAAATKAADNNSHVRWADRVVAETETIIEEDEVDSDDEEDSDGEDYEDLATMAPLRRVASQPPVVYTQETMVFYDDEDQYEDDEEDADLALVRTPSQQSPPELVHDDDFSDDESPSSTASSSPPQPALEFPEPDRKEALASTMPLFPPTTAADKDDHSLDLLLSEVTNAPLVASC